jgi:TonB family protein
MDGPSAASPSYRSLAAPARWLTWTSGLLGLLCVLSLLQVARLRYLTEAVAARRPFESDFLARWLAPDGVRSGALSFDGMLFAMVESLGRIEIAAFVLALPAGVLFYFLLFRVRASVVALGEIPRYAKHWIVTGFAVPVLNLVRPYQVVADLWRTSASPARPRGKDSPVLVRLWWETLIVANVLSFAVGWRLARRPEAAAGLIAGTALARLVMLALLVLLVRSFAERLDARAAAREPRSTLFDRLPAHAGVDVALLGVLALAVGAGTLLGGRAPGGVRGGLPHEQEVAAVEAAREWEARESEAAGPGTEVGILGADGGMGGAESGVEGTVEGSAAGGMPGDTVVGAASALVGARPLRVARLERVAGDSPRYPTAAKQAGIQGTVLLELVVDERGEVVEVRVIEGLPMGLTEAAFDAATTWRFRPAEVEGRPVRTVHTVPVVFRLAP